MIDLNEIIKSGVAEKELAKALFPGNKFPRQALARQIGQNLPLNEKQVLALSQITGRSIQDLYGSDWKSHNKDGVFYFEKSGFKAELDTNTWITRVMCNQKRVHEELITSKSVLLSEYLENLDKLIKNYKG